MRTQRFIPIAIAALFAADLALVLIYIADFLAGSPIGQLHRWLDVNGERSLPTWFSSIQWFCAALLFTLIPARLWRTGPLTIWVLGAIGVVCLAFSVDEIIGVHEWLGRETDALLPGGTRDNSAFAYTGLWPFVVGIPVVLGLSVVLVMLQRLIQPGQRTASRLLVVGFALMFTGALLIELTANLIDIDPDGTGPKLTGLMVTQLAVEELFEMVGATFVVWSAYEFAVAHGLTLQIVVSNAAAAHSIERITSRPSHTMR